MEFRRAQSVDFDGMVTLLDANLTRNLTDDQKRDGFLSVRFTADQFAKMNDNLCVIVAVERGIVRAFLCASNVAFNEPFDLPRTMIDRFPKVLYRSKPLSDRQICIAGPTCIDSSWRGHGVLQSLYRCFLDIVPSQYELVTAFVSQDNPRSLRACEKLGMTVVDKFHYRARQYVIVAGELNLNLEKLRKNV